MRHEQDEVNFHTRYATILFSQRTCYNAKDGDRKSFRDIPTLADMEAAQTIILREDKVDGDKTDSRRLTGQHFQPARQSGNPTNVVAAIYRLCRLTPQPWLAPQCP